ncbi:MAG: M14 family metallopeptidase [Bryobacteraceae bacterium]
MLRSLAALLACGCFLSAQTKFEYWPGATYDPAVPTHKKVLGYDPGDHVSSHAQIMQYMDALASAYPNRMKVWEYAKTWEGRKLVYAAIGSEANIKRLPQIQADIKRLADPRKTSDADAKRIMANLPAIVWLAYGVHGNEISSPDAALMTAYHLLASRNDKIVDDIMAKTVVMIVPLQNPDGRERFVFNYDVSAGLEPDANPLAAEHSEPWPGGRTNHYYFDMNRDWLAMTQPEIRGQIHALQEWLPLIYVDLHEMGTEGTYYFAPDANPINPHLTKAQEENQNWFGKNNARYFDKFGFSYFTGETYDAFYPGYGASWPAYYGGISMTYENGSTRGLVVKKNDETVVTYRETVRRHFITSIATCETTAQHRSELLEEFFRYRKSAIEEGSKDPIREYILARHGDVTTVDKLAQLLVEHGIEVKRATAQFSNGAKQYPAGSYVISLAQPAKRLVRVLMDSQVSMSEEFLKAEEARRKRRQPSEIYDVTAWSLPLQYNVEAATTGTVSDGKFEPVVLGNTPKGIVNGKAEVAYVIPWGTSGAAKMMTALLHSNYKIVTNDRPFTLEGKRYELGALVLKVKDNTASLEQDIHKLAESTGADVDTHNTSWADDGPTFGSSHFSAIRKPAILIAWDRPTSGGSAGQARFVIERQFGYPTTVIRTEQLGSANLSQYQTIILPDGGGYAASLGGGGVRRLKEWVQAGGTLIGIDGAIGFLAAPATGLLSTSEENGIKEGATPTAAQTGGGRGGGRGGAPETPAAAPPAADATRVAPKIFVTPADLDLATQPGDELPGSLHGALAKIKVDREHWITAGVPETVYALVSGRSIYQPVKMDHGFNAAVFAGPNDVLASGYMWDEYRKQLAFKPFVIVERSGRGNVIAFTADPNYRAYMDGLNLLFLNAVFRGPAHAGGGRGGAQE